MRVGIVPVRVVDRHIGAHALADELLTDILRQQIDPVQPAQLNGQGDDELTGQSAVFCFLGFLHGVPENGAVLPLRRRTVREKDLLPDKPLLAGIVMLYAVVVVIDG